MAEFRRIVSALAGAMLLSALVTLGVGAATSAAASAACYPPGSPSCTGTLTTSTGTVAPGGTFTLNGSGFAAGASVTINVCNLETLHVTANSSGSFSLPITIPTTAAPGSCTITASGEGNSGSTLTLTTSITITSASTVPPTNTGEPWSGWVYWALAGATGLFGFGLVEFGRRRRFRMRSTT